ncbi:hypothetical protein [Thaumasiovibrio subtropicus]|uniref:hypothetical protein n=1 Tax=Thaumasiovibrio subtropicus TaxID=1891207 RepID=UPI000B34F9CA|nr:hypothetical protein [Thaumasiovibrio subtropicus]
MKIIGLSIILVLLVGCGMTPQQSSAVVELYYAEEQVTLTAKQKASLSELFQHAKACVADVAPATNETPFQALITSQQRLKAIRSLAQQHNTELIEHYQPQQTADTVILRGL